jgi:hypothetical protein
LQGFLTLYFKPKYFILFYEFKPCSQVLWIKELTHIETVLLIEKKQVEIKGFHDFIIKYYCVLYSLGLKNLREFFIGGAQFGGSKVFCGIV